jgi:hypothetical protein
MDTYYKSIGVEISLSNSSMMLNALDEGEKSKIADLLPMN